MNKVSLEITARRWRMRTFRERRMVLRYISSLALGAFIVYVFNPVAGSWSIAVGFTAILLCNTVMKYDAEQEWKRMEDGGYGEKFWI